VSGPRFELLSRLFGDGETEAIFAERATVQAWLDVEAALAAVQADLGLIGPDAARAIAEAATADAIDLPRLWSQARTVGYPILPLISQLEAALPAGHRGCVHLGATTQDIMDTALALQLKAAAARQAVLVQDLGDCFAGLAERHEGTLIAARTHAQQAVPTVLGAKFAVYLSELARQRARLATAAADACVVSLFGAGGTSAGYGDKAGALRAGVAARLGLRPVEVPWHVARDGLSAFCTACASTATTCARFAREVIDLARTEIAEVSEADGYLRGASSTMPQKRNPIGSEAVVGLAVSAQALSAAMLRAMEAGHERSAGEWQAEWQALPQVVCMASAALLTASRVAADLQVFPDRMHANLSAEGDLLMAEAYMMKLAPVIGRGNAHKLVYDAVLAARREREPLVAVLRRSAPAGAQAVLASDLRPQDYLGDPARVIAEAISAWRTEGSGRPGRAPP
jgi:3-carboxy-cis,cis-muconate cycloisomerase